MNGKTTSDGRERMSTFVLITDNCCDFTLSLIAYINMSSTASTPLFACSRCFSRHPFEELSPGEQLCKECRGSFPVVKCTYCRSEFQQTSKSNTSSICKKCEANVKAYGKPTACEYCNIIAAFIGNKCQRCTNSERKYGPAVSCEQCKQRYSSMNDSQPHEKKAKMNPMQGELDPNSSDHVVAMTQLKETIASLQKKVQQKDSELLSKDKLITELKAQHHNNTCDIRNEIKNKDRLNETKFTLMNTKIQNLLKEVATLSKSNKKNNKNTKSALANAENSGSGTDSPSTN
ncbi:Protein FAM76A [Operophtera brumata]|uniref:Protein FAM76A n=1 Tax=Operophtera brumata TaxID=104452 RepID=A0A0L7L476_OPEBR|nr:Protein FAM76A [Operophtera brumata]